MRQVRVFTSVLEPSPDVPGKFVKVRKESLGVFHDFAIDSWEVSPGQIMTNPVGIIEDKFGHLHVIPVADFSFINPTPYATCEDKPNV